FRRDRALGRWRARRIRVRGRPDGVRHGRAGSRATGAQAMMPEGYMSRELLLQADALAREKNVHKDVVFGALEMAIASATKKRFTEDVDVRVAIDRNTGEFESFRRWQVVADGTVENPSQQIALSEAQKQDPDLQLGDFIEEGLEPIDFGRIGAQTAKQVILQRIRDAEREQLLNDFLARGEKLINGAIKRVE